MRRHLIALPLAVLLTATPALAQEETPESLAAEGLKRLMQAIELFVDTLPLYAAPEVMPNGDIIIRRINPEDTQTDPDKQEGQTET